MKDAYEVLYQKEADLVRVRQEIESLRIAASLLDDPSVDVPEQSSERRPAVGTTEGVAGSDLDSSATGTDGPSLPQREPGFWKSLKSRRR